MNKNIKHFDNALNKKQPSVFDEFKKSFKGSTQIENKKDNEELKRNLIYAGITAIGLIGAITLGKVSINNIRKTAQNTNEFANKLTEKTIDAIQNISKKANKEDIPTIETLLKSICIVLFSIVSSFILLVYNGFSSFIWNSSSSYDNKIIFISSG